MNKQVSFTVNCNSNCLCFKKSNTTTDKIAFVLHKGRTLAQQHPSKSPFTSNKQNFVHIDVLKVIYDMGCAGNADVSDTKVWICTIKMKNTLLGCDRTLFAGTFSYKILLCKSTGR